MKKITSKFMALILSLLTVMGTMTTPAFAAEDLTPGSPGTLTERYIDESTSRAHYQQVPLGKGRARHRGVRV